MIVTHKDTDIKENVGCIFLEYISGCTLANKDVLQMSPKSKFIIIKQLLSAIEMAHDSGIIHRDINPNNIMIDDNGDIKVIDFGICKIKEMVNNSTVYQMVTNRYSAPEVCLHSQNATEQSDLYSIGAVIYYLFTGKQPTIATNFQQTIQDATGFDVELKPILVRLASMNPEDRYSNILELKRALSGIVERFLDVRYNAVITMDREKFIKLKQLNLIPRKSKMGDLDNVLADNFLDLHINRDENNYAFLGNNYLLECIYNDTINIFQVFDIKKIVPIKRENLKKKFCKLSARLNFPNPELVHRLSQNDNVEIKNIVDSHCEEYHSKHNIDEKYSENYGAWRKLLSLTKKSIEDNVIKYSYNSYKIEGNICSFRFSDGVFIGDKVFDKETRFAYKKKYKGKDKLYYIGTYEDDILEDEHVVMNILFTKKPQNLPARGTICIDYSKDVINIDRQLEALDNIERENYECQYNLKEIFSGITAPKSDSLYGNIKFCNEKLDSSQQKAVEKALRSESIAIIQGPPGTGKTNVVIEIIRQILKTNRQNPELPDKKILLVSQSHPAVDKMLDDLIQQNSSKPNLIRVGRDEKLNSEIREDFGLNYVKTNWIEDVRQRCKETATKYCEELGIKYDDFEKCFVEYEKSLVKDADLANINVDALKFVNGKTNSPSKERIRKILEIQMQWSQQLSQCEEVDLYIIKDTTIIAGTCTGFISNKVIRDTVFDYVIVDEAAKATYSELAVSFSRAEKIILVGDHKQLPPVLDQEIIDANKDELKKEDLMEGLFEKLYNNFPDTNRHRLSMQYRMHPVIGSMISKVFYENEIQNGTPAEKRVTGIPDYSETAIEWITTSKLPTNNRYEKMVGDDSNATYKNNAELNIIKRKLQEIDLAATREIRLGVITAYKAQKIALKEMVRQQKFKNLRVEVDTVDAFQGGQKEIIIYSTVRSSDKSRRIGFLKSEARLNVSLSRAQSLLIIVGDLDFLNNPQINGNKFPEIIDYITQSKGCKITIAGE